MQRHTTTGVHRRARVIGLSAIAVSAALVLVAVTRASSSTNEFNNPNPTQLPAVSTYNTTPSCPLNAGDYFYCDVPSSSWPPKDRDNPERYLNSAYWPAEKRPDIWVYAVEPYGYYYKNCANKLPHYCFLVDAEAVGYPITHTPQVGDLWVAPGECLAYGPGAPLPAGCTDNANDWYAGYVEQVFPDGSFIQSWGGSDTPADSGLGLTWFSGAMDAQTDFIPVLSEREDPGLAIVPKPSEDAFEITVKPGAAHVGKVTIQDGTGKTLATPTVPTNSVWVWPGFGYGGGTFVVCASVALRGLYASGSQCSSKTTYRPRLKPAPKPITIARPGVFHRLHAVTAFEVRFRYRLGASVSLPLRCKFYALSNDFTPRRIGKQYVARGSRSGSFSLRDLIGKRVLKPGIYDLNAWPLKYNGYWHPDTLIKVTP